jgi:hypothetical protein
MAPRLTQPPPQCIPLLSPRGQIGDSVGLTSCPHVVLRFNKELNYTSNLPVPPWHVKKRNLLYSFICLFVFNLMTLLLIKHRTK